MKTKLFTLLVALLATNNLWAKFQYGNLYYETLSSNTAEVVGCYIDDPTSVSIPTLIQYNGKQYTVTSIGDYAFFDCSSLTSVTIPNSVTSIGEDAFFGCSSLTSITIPSSVKSIGEEAFENCTSLISITIPNSVTSIGDDAFAYCTSLTSITIPNSVTSIGDGAFRGCSSVTSIVVDSRNSTYDSRDNCNAIIETATNTLVIGYKNTIIPNSVTSIGDYAFSDCDALTSITIPNSVTSIGKRAFCWCSSLTSITIPNSVTSIGESAFYGCFSLTSITIPNSVTSIGDDAFAYCFSLTSVTIPNSVTSIGDYAFSDCDALTSITIGNSVTSIGENAFYRCTALTIVICKAILVPSTGKDVFAYVPISSAVLYVPDESMDIYKYMYPWDGFGSILPISQLPTDVEDVQISSDKDASVKKVIRNGQIVILHNDKSYNIMGQEVE